jgi:hypothetical protein
VVHGGRRCDAAELFGGKAEVPKLGVGAAMEVAPHVWRRRYRGCSARSTSVRLVALRSSIVSWWPRRQ